MGSDRKVGTTETPIALITADPGLPRSNPTDSYWQNPPHPLADTRSYHHRHNPLPDNDTNTTTTTATATTDIAVIGSGITGLSVTKTLLDLHPTARITVLEARALCSGATGRNGGQLASNAAEEYEGLVSAYGKDMAGQIVRFTLKNLEAMYKLIEGFGVPRNEAQVEEVRKLRVFVSFEGFERFKRGLGVLEADHPDLRGVWEVVGMERVEREFGIHGSVGAALLPAGTAWPYRIVTNIFSALLKKYPSRLAIQTNTPVTSVSYNNNHPIATKTPSGTTITDENTVTPYQYTLQTAQGTTLQAGKVIYCTNGHTGHLVPKLRGPIYPFKGSMTVQDPVGTVPNHGSSLSWAFHYPSTYDRETGRRDHGLYYLLQNSRSGFFFFGGENASDEYSVSGDDGFIGSGSVEHLRGVLPAYFGRYASSWPLISAWSGIMGFSFDGLPLVGKLPLSVTNRGGDGEWIAAAFNGYGMANCLLSGEALVRMMLGEDVSEWFPGAYLIDETRLKRTRVVGTKI